MEIDPAPLRRESAASSNVRSDAIAGRASYWRTEIQKSAMSSAPRAGMAAGVWMQTNGCGCVPGALQSALTSIVNFKFLAPLDKCKGGDGLWGMMPGG
jgi:hypothetical protein